MAKKKPLNKTFTYQPSDDNYLFLLDMQTDYKKNGKSWGLSKIVDLCINRVRVPKN